MDWIPTYELKTWNNIRIDDSVCIDSRNLFTNFL